MKEYAIYFDEGLWVCEIQLNNKIIDTACGQSPEMALKKAIMYDESEEE